MIRDQASRRLSVVRFMVDRTQRQDQHLIKTKNAFHNQKRQRHGRIVIPIAAYVTSSSILLCLIERTQTMHWSLEQILPWFIVRDPSLDAIAKPLEAHLSVLHEPFGGDVALPPTVLCF